MNSVCYFEPGDEMDETISAAIIAGAFSILVSLVALVTSLINNRKIKEIEKVKTSLKLKEMKREMEYKNLQTIIEEVYNIYCLTLALSPDSDYYLLLDDKEKKKTYNVQKREVKESLIWTRKRIHILSVYMDTSLFQKIEALLNLSRSIIENCVKFPPIQSTQELFTKFRDFGQETIKAIQKETERIIEEKLDT